MRGEPVTPAVRSAPRAREAGRDEAEPRTAPVGSCPACSVSGAEVAFRVPDRLHGTRGLFTYKRCGSCGTVFQDPVVVPEDLPLCYPRAYYTHEPLACGPPTGNRAQGGESRLRRIRDALRGGIIAAFRGDAVPRSGAWGLAANALARSKRLRERAFYDHVLDELLPRGTGRRALDIGCGNGRLMLSLARVGWDPEGIEWDPVAAAAAAAFTGCVVHRGDFREAPLPRFDLVVMNHVLEHLHRPVEALGRIADLLEPGGRAVLVWPNPRSLGARTYGDSWFHLDPPRHLVLPPLAALKSMATKAGLVPVGSRTHARSAAVTSAHSRSYRAGKSVDEQNPDVVVRDRAIGWLEYVLVLLGLEMGEEAVAVLTRA